MTELVIAAALKLVTPVRVRIQPLPMTETELGKIEGRLEALWESEQASTTRGVLGDALELLREVRRLNTAAGGAVALVERNFGTNAGRELRQLFGLAPSTEG